VVVITRVILRVELEVLSDNRTLFDSVVGEDRV